MRAPNPQRPHTLHSALHLIRRSLLLLLTCTLLAGPLAAQTDQGTLVLELGKPVERELVGGQAHSYRIALAAGQFLSVVVDQRGIDVVVTLFDPDGKKIVEVDSPNGAQGPEPVSLIAETTGNYLVNVRSLEESAALGRYKVIIKKLRTATEQDKNYVAAEQAIMEGEQLRTQATKEALRKAIGKYEESILFSRAIGDRFREATAFYNIGLAYNDLGETQKAIDSFNQTLPLMRAVGDRSGEALTLTNMGAIYNILGEKQKALDLFNESLPLEQALSDHFSEAVTLNNIAGAYYDLGETQKAFDLFHQALSLFRDLGDRYSEAMTLTAIGGIYTALGEKQKALSFYEQSLPLFRAVGDRPGEATALNSIGSVYDDLDDKQKALAVYNQALVVERVAGDRLGEARTLNDIGAVYYSLREYQKTLNFFNESLPISRAVGDRAGEASTLVNTGSVFSALGEKNKALDFYHQALSISRSLRNLFIEAKTLYHIAVVENDLGNLAKALNDLSPALSIVEALRVKIGSHELRSSYFASMQNYYDFYIDLQMRLHKRQPSAGHVAEALQASERGRARSLLELLTEAGADIRQGVDPKLVARERALQLQLNASAQRQIQLLSGPHTEEQANAIAKEIDTLTTEFQQVETQIRQTSPRYAALTQPQPLTLKEIQTQVLDADTVLLEYALGTDRSYLWAVTPTSITSYELPKRAEIEMAARAFYTILHTPPQQASNEVAKHGLGAEMQQQAQTQSAQVAAQLSRMLLAPASALLGKKRLLIVADGALQYIPFAALPVPTSAASGAAPTPLIIEHEIVSLPSASALAVLRREAGEHKAVTKTLAVLADPVFERTDERFKPSASRMPCNVASRAALADESRGLGLVVLKSAQDAGVSAADLRIPRLPATRREADAISQLAPPAARLEALDFAASRAAATDPALADYRFVHFATHGFLDSQHPELSGIMLSMFDEQGRAQDGFLRAHEVFNLKLNADVVVLSACQTGLGKDVKGEGLVGLTRGFMYAGAPRVVVSLWSVNDAATAELMTRFYRGMLVDKLRPAQALQAAQVSMLRDKRFSAPFYWAAFTLQGEWR